MQNPVYIQLPKLISTCMHYEPWYVGNNVSIMENPLGTIDHL